MGSPNVNSATDEVLKGWQTRASHEDIARTAIIAAMAEMPGPVNWCELEGIVALSAEVPVAPIHSALLGLRTSGIIIDRPDGLYNRLEPAA